MAFRIKHGCVGCHYCKLECPVEAIRYVGAGYQIDPEKCTGCGRCADVCHSGLIYDTAAPEETEESHDAVYLNCDILIIGAGGVGTGAAAHAGVLGYNTILIEAAKNYGGGTYYAHGAVFPASQTVYSRLGITDDLDQRTEFFKLFAEMQGGSLDENVLKENIRVNGRFMDFFDSLDPSYCSVFTKASPGFPFEFDMPARHINTKAEDDSIGPGWMGSYITDKLFETAMKHGVRYFNRTRALEFISDAEGNITGVAAEDPGGKVYISARAVVLGTGGYMMNDERMKAIDPNLVREGAGILRLNVPTNIGDGHDMVAKIGGDVDYKRGEARGPVHHPYCYPVYKLMDYPENVFFSDEGVRLFELSNRKPGGGPFRSFEKPDPDSPEQLILKSQTGKCYVIMDSGQLEEAGERLVENIMPGHDDYLVKWREVIEEEAALEDLPARKADSIAELAIKLGMNSEILTAGVGRYNALCDCGYDEDFGKPAEYMRPIRKAPFYAFLGQTFDNGASQGGVSIDNEFRVLREDGGVFHGLYCAGDCATNDTRGSSPAGLCGGLGGAWASGYQIIHYIDLYFKKAKDDTESEGRVVS